MTPENTHGKSSADLALALDAMDLLFNGDIESFCLCSSGSDFSRLARTLTGFGKHVIGIGGRSSCSSFAVSCESFIPVQDLLEDHGALLSCVIRGEAQAQGQAAAPLNEETERVSGPVTRHECAAPVMHGGEKKKHRKVNVCDIGNELRKEIPNFSSLDYGFAKFKSFLKSFRFLKFESHKGKKTFVTIDSHYRMPYE